ncbi:hypothetical protein P9112_003612 [Eukaryota sp. TZLM1-RC]
MASPDELLLHYNQLLSASSLADNITELTTCLDSFLLLPIPSLTSSQPDLQPLLPLLTSTDPPIHLLKTVLTILFRISNATSSTPPTLSSLCSSLIKSCFVQSLQSSSCASSLFPIISSIIYPSATSQSRHQMTFRCLLLTLPHLKLNCPSSEQNTQITNQNDCTCMDLFNLILYEFNDKIENLVDIVIKGGFPPLKYLFGFVYFFKYLMVASDFSIIEFNLNYYLKLLKILLGQSNSDDLSSNFELFSLILKQLGEILIGFELSQVIRQPAKKSQGEELFSDLLIELFDKIPNFTQIDSLSLEISAIFDLLLKKDQLLNFFIDSLLGSFNGSVVDLDKCHRNFDILSSINAQNSKTYSQISSKLLVKMSIVLISQNIPFFDKQLTLGDLFCLYQSTLRIPCCRPIILKKELLENLNFNDILVYLIIPKKYVEIVLNKGNSNQFDDIFVDLYQNLIATCHLLSLLQDTVGLEIFKISDCLSENHPVFITNFFTQINYQRIK